MKYNLRTVFIISVLFAFSSNCYSQNIEIPKEERLEWFKDAKLGIFIHWGIYSVMVLMSLGLFIMVTYLIMNT